MTATTASARRLLGICHRLPRALLRRACTGVQRASRATAIPIQVTLDGHDLLNWRSADPSVRALLLRSRTERTLVAVPALDAAGPPHGVLSVGDLVLGSQTIRVRTSRGVRPALLIPAGDGTRNEIRDVERGAWHLEPGPPPRLVHWPAGEEPPGVLSLDAAHGLIALDIGPLIGSWTLTVERRGGVEKLPVAPRPGPPGSVRTYLLGGAQWRAAGLPPTGDTSVWDVILRRDDGAQRPVRLSWHGSGIERPREALRWRASVSYAVPGCRVEVRPYWTKDQLLALELTSTPSLGGDLA